MARPVEKRKTYIKDIPPLTRIAQAIEEDATVSDEWRHEVLTHITATIALLSRPVRDGDQTPTKA